MTLVPHLIPTWCWNLTGEDAVFFSQPTLDVFTFSTQPIDGQGACLARCTRESILGAASDDPVQVWTHPIQCGRIATPWPPASPLCELCIATLYHCDVCDTFIPEGQGMAPCPVCPAEDEEEPNPCPT